MWELMKKGFDAASAPWEDWHYPYKSQVTKAGGMCLEFHLDTKFGQALGTYLIYKKAPAAWLQRSVKLIYL